MKRLMIIGLLAVLGAVGVGAVAPAAAQERSVGFGSTPSKRQKATPFCSRTRVTSASAPLFTAEKVCGIIILYRYPPVS